MIRQMTWTDRRWTLGIDPGLFPGILERLRGTPARAEDLVRGVPREILAARQDGAWSVLDHIGHLDDLDELDRRRVADFRARAPVLTAADMTNRKTNDAAHNERGVEEVLWSFRASRHALVRELESLTDEDLAAVSLHPRLQQPMRVVDWAFFAAEHDDHHLARVSELLRALRVPA